jgi:hypothetical protein
MKLKELGIAVLETTSAGSIASVASSLFTPTSDGRPALIRRTKKKKDKDPSIYEGSTKPEYHNTQVKGKDPIPSKSKPTARHQSPHPFKGKLVGEDNTEEGFLSGRTKGRVAKSFLDDPLFRKITGRKSLRDIEKDKKEKDDAKNEGDMEADREEGIKWVDNPDWEKLHNMDLNMVKDFLNHKEGITEGLTRQHFEMFANLLRDIEDRDKREDHAEFLIRAFKQDNERFDVQRFLKAADLVTEKAPPGREKQVKALKKKFKGDKSAPYAIAWAQHNKGKK